MFQGNEIFSAENLICDENLHFSPGTVPLRDRKTNDIPGIAIQPTAAPPAASAVRPPYQLDRGLQGTLGYFSTKRRCNVKYKPLRELGAGAFGVVYKCQDQKSFEIVAIKHLRLKETVDGIPQWALREIALLRRCSARHPNIIRLLDMHYQMVEGRRCDIHLVLEFCDMDLKEYIRSTAQRHQTHGLPFSVLKDTLFQILKGLDFLHIIAVAHRDIKPQNILVKDSTIKIADFGLGKIMFERAPVSLEVVTLHYRPPEVLLSVNYSLAVDIWSVGCIFAEMCNNLVLLGGDSEIGQLKTIFSVLGMPSVEDWPVNCSVGHEFFRSSPRDNLSYLDRFCKYVGMRGVDLMKNMLLFNPVKRCSTYSALQHDFFSGHVSLVNYENMPPVSEQMQDFELAVPSAPEVGDCEVSDTAINCPGMLAA